MQNKIKIRIAKVLIILLSCSLGIYIILYNLENNITFFYPPSKVINNNEIQNIVIRVGGLVKEGSIYKNGIDDIIFNITDNSNEITIKYKGILPALFREKQGIVAQGKFNKEQNVFIATQLLTKHDENYMPPQN